MTKTQKRVTLTLKCRIGEKSGRQFNNDGHKIIETHSLMPRLSDRQTVFPKGTVDSPADIQTAKQSAVVPLQPADMESRLREGLFYHFFTNYAMKPQESVTWFPK